MCSFVISIVNLCLTLCSPVDYSTLGFPVLHDLLEFAQEYIPYIVSSHHTYVSVPVCVWACVSLHP